MSLPIFPSPEPPAPNPEHQAPANLRRLMARAGLTLADLAERTRLNPRTLRGILDGRTTPQARTLHRLAQGLEVAVDELFDPPALVAQRRFDRATNPVVEDAVAGHPRLFAGWSVDDFAELSSRFGTGGALTASGAVEAARQMNHHREVQRKVALLLETAEAELLTELVNVLYRKVQVRTAADAQPRSSTQPRSVAPHAISNQSVLTTYQAP